MSPEHKYALPPGLALRQYRIVRLLGHGGFGLTYLADDTSLHRQVAIKELLPMDFAVREPDGTTVVARSRGDVTNLDWARRRFVEEGQTLAGLHHPSILPVFEIFEQHGTAYLVTSFVEGGNLEAWLRKAPRPSEKDLRAITLSLLDALELVHERGFLHRDVKPENILVEERHLRPILIDFGNARVATGEKTSNLTAVLTKGYAPFEQYQTKGRQGPSTDFYALGAVLYRAIKGVAPDDALDRLEEDKIQILSRQQIPGYDREFLATIDKALKMRREDRWQSAAAWKAALDERQKLPLPKPVPQPSKILPVLVALAFLVFACVGIGSLVHHLWTSDSWKIWKKKTIAISTPPDDPILHLRRNPFLPDPSFPTPGSGNPYLPPGTHFPSLFPTPTPTPQPSTPSRSKRLTTLLPPTPTPPGFFPFLTTPHPSASPTPKAPGFLPLTFSTPPPVGGSPSPKPLPSWNPSAVYPWAPAPNATPTPTPAAQPYVNSLGMKFIPVFMLDAAFKWKRVLFCVWDTRVSDWQEFIKQSGDTPQAGILTFNEATMQWGLNPNLSWRNPGFLQTSQDPVVGVNWEDARRFCAWLSKKEGKTYRLPTSSEWAIAAGFGKFPWGNNFPPPAKAGNYAGTELVAKPSAWTIAGYNDGFPRTSPVGSFPPNPLGLYDMGGNVWQWCDDIYRSSMNTPEALKDFPFLKDEQTNGAPRRVVRGGAWGDFSEMYLRSSFCAPAYPLNRRSDCGFRCVLELPGS